jgi:type II secretory pathway pseudopilin PulG
MNRGKYAVQLVWCGRGALTPQVLPFASQVSRGGGTPPTKTKRPPKSWSRAFTLLELLVVVGLIAALSFFLIGGLRSGNTAALQSAQALLANLASAARAKAMATGQSSRILVQIDADGGTLPPRFLRYVALQTRAASGWETIAGAYLPDGVYVVPGNFSVNPAGLFAADTAVPWERADGSALRSTALRSNQITNESINGAGAEQWVSFTISANAGTAQSGDIVLAIGRPRSPGSFAAGESPVELINPETVRGLTLSSYGVPALINARTSF